MLIDIKTDFMPDTRPEGMLYKFGVPTFNSFKVIHEKP